ncbi:hypothetical protein KEM56_007513 [Ascosphaera pollenicola]|nr:hypothetical protein KEM56_007513 [Ascosphaera pollenicola]
MAVPSLSGEKLLLLLAFSTTLAEDSASVSGTTEIEARNRLGLNVKDAVLLNEFTLNTVLSREDNVKFGDTDQLADAAGEAIKSLSISGVLSFLSGPPGENYAMSLLQGEYEDENMNFLELLLAYASMGSQELLTKPLDMQTERVVFLLHTLFRVPGFAEVDEKVSTLLLEFWTNAADDLRDTLMEGDIEIVPDQAKMELAQAINDCYPKLCYPDPTTHRWDEDERRNFAGFRRDYADFLMGSYPLLGSGLVKQFQERASAALASNDWGNFEVAISCLAFLSDAVADLEEMDPIFHSIFLSPAFEEMCFNRVMLPKRTRQTLADMIARYTTYFERNPATIPRTLNLLFNSLELPSCDRIASKSISVLCQSCRKALVVYVEEFINKFNALRSRPSVSPMTLERVAEGIAAIITAIPSDIGKVNCLTNLLEPFEQVAKLAQQQWQQGQAEEALASALQAIRCTASIGKGYRDQDDGPISLDDDEDKSYVADFWGVNGPGGAPQACIMRILNILVNTFSFDGEVIEAACDVLRAGYTESKPGPYVLPPQVTVDFVKASAVVTSPRFSTIMATATSFLASHDPCNISIAL